MKVKVSHRSKGLTVKELAAELGHSRGYVHAMKKMGFVMRGKRATVAGARRWLARHRRFTWRAAYRAQTL